MSDVPIVHGLERCSLRDTEACLPRALCSPGWKQLISNCLHSNYLIVQKHCLVFQFSLSHCLPEGLFTALSLIWVGGMPVGEVNCQDRKKHHGSKKLLPNWTDLGSGFCVNKSCEGLTFLPSFFFLFARKVPFSPPSPELWGFVPLSLRGFLSSLIFPVYSTFPLLVISEPGCSQLLPYIRGNFTTLRVLAFLKALGWRIMSLHVN